MIGEHIRTLREANDILLRQLAAKLEMDQAMLSKMERGERSFRREDIDALAKIFKQPKKELLTLWLADKILKTTENQRYKKEALQLAIDQFDN
ncbi:helix-turn-helix domain-containing protein [Winogradskyella schleiferi]|nr:MULTISPECIES: helix-turn-helix transcriptional regulator [Flavobacteriaceae]